MLISDRRSQHTKKVQPSSSRTTEMVAITELVQLLQHTLDAVLDYPNQLKSGRMKMQLVTDKDQGAEVTLEGCNRVDDAKITN
ncbi:unnamed protein product [Cochlearia groenlandica]